MANQSVRGRGSKAIFTMCNRHQFSFWIPRGLLLVGGENYNPQHQCGVRQRGRGEPEFKNNSRIKSSYYLSHCQPVLDKSLDLEKFSKRNYSWFSLSSWRNEFSCLVLLSIFKILRKYFSFSSRFLRFL